MGRANTQAQVKPFTREMVQRVVTCVEFLAIWLHHIAGIIHALRGRIRDASGSLRRVASIVNDYPAYVIIYKNRSSYRPSRAVCVSENGHLKGTLSAIDRSPRSMWIPGNCIRRKPSKGQKHWRQSFLELVDRIVIVVSLKLSEQLIHIACVERDTSP
jgi:hypothetical protein